jgi:hypothetical protein
MCEHEHAVRVTGQYTLSSVLPSFATFMRSMMVTNPRRSGGAQVIPARDLLCKALGLLRLP